ncbi:MAG: type II toxin-antitoxin system HipA family toxin [Deferribacterales bacterium]
MESVNVFIEVKGEYIKAGNLISTGVDMLFEYDEKYSLNGLSLILPVEERLFEGTEARIFFENLLPEGEQRQIISRATKISSENVFGLLKRFGGECAGAVVITQEDDLSGTDNKYKLLKKDDILSLIEKLDQTTPAEDNDMYRLSLAGAQAKTSVKIENDKIYLPYGNSPSTHIIKPFNRLFSGLPANELFCNQLAKECGLPVCNTEIRKVGKQSALFIERYDRYINGDKICRLHQEDFCQALGYSYAVKYELEGGPSFSDCVDLVVKQSAQPAADKMLLVRWFIFNYLIGNADAHAKNISLIYPENMKGRPVLTPFYDLVCTSIYRGISSKMAMSVRGEFEPSKVFSQHWSEFCDVLDIKYKVFHRYSNEIISAILRSEIYVTPANELIGNICDVIKDRIERLQENN